MADPGVIVVGAGPAGVRAAETLVDAGLRPIVIDEGTRDGGQIYRRQPDELHAPLPRRSTAPRRTAPRRCTQPSTRLRARIDYRPETLAWNCRTARSARRRATARRSAIPFDAADHRGRRHRSADAGPGWNRAGVYSLGAAQIALKSQACADRPRGRVPRHRAAALSRRRAICEGRREGRRGARHLAARRGSSRRCRSWSRGPACCCKGIALLATLKRGRRRRSHAGSRRSRSTAMPRRACSGVRGPARRRPRAPRSPATPSPSATICDRRPSSPISRAATSLRCARRANGCRRVDADGRSTVAGRLSRRRRRAHPRRGWRRSCGTRLRRWRRCADLGPRSSPDASCARCGARARQHGPLPRRAWPRRSPGRRTSPRRCRTRPIVCRCEAITAGELRASCREHGRARDQSRQGVQPRRHGTLPGPLLRPCRRRDRRGRRRRAARAASAGCAARRRSSRCRSRRRRSDAMSADARRTSSSSAAASWGPRPHSSCASAAARSSCSSAG